MYLVIPGLLQEANRLHKQVLRGEVQLLQRRPVKTAEEDEDEEDEMAEIEDGRQRNIETDAGVKETAMENNNGKNLVW